MNKRNYLPKTLRISKNSFQDHPCTSDRVFPNPSSYQKQESIFIQPISLNKAASCTSLGSQLAESLVSRIREVERRCVDDSKLKQLEKKLGSPRLKLQKSKQKLVKYKESNWYSQLKGQIISEKQQVSKIKQKSSLVQAQLRSQIQQLHHNNNILQNKIRQLQQQLFCQKQEVQNLLNDLQIKDKIIEGLEQTMLNDRSECKSKWGIYCNILKQDDNQSYLQKTLQGIYSKKRCQLFKIEKVFSESIVGFASKQKVALLKANCEIHSLKRQLSSLQKIYDTNYAELINKKNDEIEQLRKNFSFNLKHYKKMIIKCTSKKNEENEKEVMESTILNSSIIQN